MNDDGLYMEPPSSERDSVTTEQSTSKNWTVHFVPKPYTHQSMGPTPTSPIGKIGQKLRKND